MFIPIKYLLNKVFYSPTYSVAIPNIKKLVVFNILI